MGHEDLISKLRSAISEGDDEEAARFAEEAIAAHIAPMTLVEEGVQPAMDVIGDRFGRGDAFLPELILAGDAARAVLDKITPHISKEERAAAERGTVVIGTVLGDNHDIGKNLVAALLSASGFRVVDLGINVPPSDFLRMAVQEKADIIAASALLTTSLPYQRDIARNLEDSGRRGEFFYIVGGGSTTGKWAKQIGADGYGFDAHDAVNLCRKLTETGVKPPLDEPILEGQR